MLPSNNKPLILTVICALAGAALWLAPLRAQQGSPQPPLAQAPQQAPAPPAPQPGSTAEKADHGAVFRTDTRLVVLPVTVVDKTGHLVTNLPRTAFQVFENNVQQEIKVFKREDVPVSMGLIVDNSGSMRDKREKVKDASLALVKDSNPQDEVFVVNFNDDAYLDTKDFTADIKEMEEALSKIDSRGGTAMRDAIRMSIDHMKEKAKRDKRVLVIVTDGNDNASMINLENLVKAAQQSEVLIYTIGLLSEEEHREAKKAEARAESLGAGHRRRGILPQGGGRRGPHRTPRWRATSATSTPSPTAHNQPGARWQLPADQGAGERSQPPHGTNPERLLRHTRNRRPPFPGTRPAPNDPRTLAPYQGLPPAPLAQPLPPVAPGNLLGRPRRRYSLSRFLEFRPPAPQGTAEVPAVGRPHAPADGLSRSPALCVPGSVGERLSTPIYLFGLELEFGFVVVLP